ncbi:MAG: FHA domain-containing protein [Pseudomonadota bacterium]
MGSSFWELAIAVGSRPGLRAITDSAFTDGAFTDSAFHFHADITPADNLWGAFSSFLGVCQSMALQLGQIYEEVPALFLAFGLLAAVPALALVGLSVPARRTRSVARLDGATSASNDTAEAEAPHARRFGRLSHSTGGAATAHAADGDANRAALASHEIGAAALKIGSGADCDVCVDGPGIADLHALVLVDPAGQHTIIQMAGRKDVGIFVDGTSVSSQTLEGGEVIRIGAHIFSFHLDCHGLDPMPVQAAGCADDARDITSGDRQGERGWAGIGSSRARPVREKSEAHFSVH